MKIDKLFRVLVMGGAALGMGAGCGEGVEGDDGLDEGTQQVQRLPDGGVADAGTPAAKKPTTSTGSGSGGGGVSGW